MIPSYKRSLEMPVGRGCSRYGCAKTGYFVQMKAADVYRFKVLAAKTQASAVSKWAMLTLVDQ